MYPSYTPAELLAIKTKMLNRYGSILKSVVEIQWLDNNNQSGSASGFLVGNCDKVFLVTNKHVISEYMFNTNFSFYKKISISFYTKNGETHPVDIPLVENENLFDYVKIHDNKFIDVACIDITSFVKEMPDTVLLEVFNFNQLLSCNLFEISNIKTGSPIVACGYPFGIADHKNFPVSLGLIIGNPISGNEMFDFPPNTSLNIIDEVNGNAFNVIGRLPTGMSGAPIVSLAEDYLESAGLTDSVVGIAAIVHSNGNNGCAFNSDSIIEVLEMFN